MKSSMRPRLNIVVLAAGFSRRLGARKALARVHGMSLIRRTVRILAPLGAAELIVVLPPRAARMRLELRGLPLSCIENRRRAGGLSTSICRGLAAARAGAAVLFLPVDLAHLERRDLERMINRWAGARRRLVARRLGASAGTPLILPRRLYGAARGLSGDRGLKSLAASLPADQRVMMDLPSAEFDVDTAQDLARARACRRGTGRQPRAVCTRR